jgi:hypothetical protein
MTRTRFVAPILCILSYTINSVSSFTIHSATSQSRISSNTKYSPSTTELNLSVDDDLSRQLAQARELIEKSKAKVAEQEKTKKETVATTIATEPQNNEIDKKTSVTKFTDDNGLITCDGDLMAALSEDEDWELKGLMDMFEDETEESDVKKSLADRDVAASIFNMRLKMHGADYRRIFDTRNRFIGEDN